MPQSIGTIPIASLPAPGPGMAVAFRIPAYQRGYRWKKDDVARLLDDLQEFLDEGDTGRPFYCLQPLVVRKANDEHNKPEHWEVVDGQQRLTTLFLIWKFLNSQPPYELSYATRERSRDFLNAPKAGENGKLANIDFHHIYHAHMAIQEWFKGDDHEKKRFKKLLADSDPNGRNVRLIWYDIGADDDAVAAFTRLNVGKIPLTDEELIRALFLRNPVKGQLSIGAFQHRLALEWDRIETALQEPDFWGFISNLPAPEGGRIRLLFELCAPEGTDTKNHALFTHYERLLKSSNSISLESEWHRIVSVFEQLDEWYRDPELFHLVGYLTAILGKKSVEVLRELLESTKYFSKPDFSTNLRSRIRTGLIKDGKKVAEFVGELDYEKNKDAILQTLALFNIATVLRTKGVWMRFPFHLYHDTKVGWDIEHVQSRAGDRLEDKPSREKWVEACRSELEHEVRLTSTQTGGEEIKKDDKAKQSAGKLLDVIAAFGNKDSAVKFSDLEGEIRAHFCEKEVGEKELNGIGNLTLLDAPTNRGYGNAPFVVKRTEILKPERPDGTFILPCTRDLFLKVFSKDPGNLRRWDIEKDGAAHETTIGEVLETFFSGKGGAES